MGENKAAVDTFLQLYRGGPALERDFYLNETHATYVKYMEKYFKLMVETVKQMGVPEETARQELRDVMNFEKTLANVSACVSILELTKYTLEKQHIISVISSLNFLHYYNAADSHQVAQK